MTAVSVSEGASSLPTRRLTDDAHLSSETLPVRCASVAMSAERESRSRRRLSRHERRQLSRARQTDDAAPLPKDGSGAELALAGDEDESKALAAEEEDAAAAIARWQQEARLERALKDRLVCH